MKISSKKVYLTLVVLQTQYTRQENSFSVTQINIKGFKFFWGAFAFSIKKKDLIVNDKVNFEEFEVILYLDASKLKLEKEITPGKLRVPKDVMRFLILKSEPILTEDELISALSVEKILGEFSINQEWISDNITRKNEYISFQGIRNFPLTEKITWDRQYSGNITVEEMKSTLAEFDLMFRSFEFDENKKTIQFDESSDLIFWFKLRPSQSGDLRRVNFLWTSENDILLEMLEERWNNLNSTLGGFCEVSSTDNEVTNPKSDEEKGSGNTEENDALWKKGFFIKVMIFLLLILGVGSLCIFDVKEKVWGKKKLLVAKINK